MSPSVLIAEWRKLWSIPVLQWLLLAPVLVGFVAGLAGGFANKPGPAMSAAWLVTMAISVTVTMLGTGSELRHRTILTSTLTLGFPRLFAAKLIVAAGVGLALGVLCGTTGTVASMLAPDTVVGPLELLATAVTGTIGTICWAVAGVGLGLVIARADFLLAGVLVWCFFGEPLIVATMGIMNLGYAVVAGPAMVSLTLSGTDALGAIDLLTAPVAVVAAIAWAGIAVGAGWRLARNRALV